MNLGDTSAADGMVIAMLLMMGISLGMVGLLVWKIRNGGAKRNLDVEALLDEVKEVEESSKPRPRKRREPKVATEPWEKDGDWWKS